MRKILLLSTLILISFGAFSQNVRTFTNFGLQTAISKDVKQYSLYWGESLQLRPPVPIRINAGLQYSFMNVASGGFSTDTSLNLSSNVRYGVIGLPVGLDFFYKNLSVGVYHELLTFSSNKKLNNPTSDLDVLVRTAGFSTFLGKKRNTSGGVYVNYTIDDSFSIRAGVNTFATTFISSVKGRETSYTRIYNNAFSLGILFNIEK